MFELDGNCLAGIEEHFVVLPDRLVLVVFDGLADGDDAAGDDGDLVAVGQDDAAFGFALVVVLANDDALAVGSITSNSVLRFAGRVDIGLGDCSRSGERCPAGGLPRRDEGTKDHEGDGQLVRIA